MCMSVSPEECFRNRGRLGRAAHDSRGSRPFSTGRMDRAGSGSTLTGSEPPGPPIAPPTPTVRHRASSRLTSFPDSFQRAEAENATAFHTQPKPLCDSFGVSLEPFVCAQRLSVMLKEGVNEGDLARLQAVVDPLPTLARRHQSGLADGLQVAGKGGLAHLQSVAELADTELALAKRGEDSHTGRIGKGSGNKHKVVHLCHGLISGIDDMIPRSCALVKKATEIC